MTDPRDPRRSLPSVDRLLAHERVDALLKRFGRQYIAQQCRDLLAAAREALEHRSVGADGYDGNSIVAQLERRLECDSRSQLQHVVNATGTLLHTNLGRATLAAAAIDAAVRAASGPINLEYDLARGERGRRESAISSLMRDLSGAEAATVVNNNAAAVLLCLNTLAMGREVLVSRGELIEIGGSFRLPDIMAKSGAVLREVGTTNRTHLADYERAIGDQTAMLLKVHASNYRIVGFSSDVALPDLVALGRRRGVPVVEDLGSGALVDLSRFGLPKEPVVPERIALGADVVTFSGDKVMGGPQSGLIVGREQYVREIAANPLHRALRCGKLTIAALEATLRLYRQSPDVAEAIPALRLFTRPLDDIERVGRELLPRLQRALGAEFQLSLDDAGSQIGSGALPAEEIPSKVVAVEHATLGPGEIAQRFRSAARPILGRIHDGRFLLDLRTVFDADDAVPVWPSA